MAQDDSAKNAAAILPISSPALEDAAALVGEQYPVHPTEQTPVHQSAVGQPKPKAARNRAVPKAALASEVASPAETIPQAATPAPQIAPPAGSFLPYPVWIVPAPWPLPDGQTAIPPLGFGQYPAGYGSAMPMGAAHPGAPQVSMAQRQAQQQFQRWLLIGIIAAVALSHLPWFSYLFAVHGCFGDFIDLCFMGSEAADLAADLPALAEGDFADALPLEGADPDAVMDVDALDDEFVIRSDGSLGESVTEQVFLFARIAMAVLYVQNLAASEWAQFSQVLQIGTGLGGFVLTKIVAANGKITQTERSRWTLVATCALAFFVLFWAQIHLTGAQTYAALGAETPLGYIDSILPPGFVGAAEAKSGLLRYLQMLRLADALILGAALAMPKAEGKT